MSERRAEQGFRGLIGEPWMLSRNAEEYNSRVPESPVGQKGGGKG